MFVFLVRFVLVIGWFSPTMESRFLHTRCFRTPDITNQEPIMALVRTYSASFQKFTFDFWNFKNAGTIFDDS